MRRSRGETAETRGRIVATASKMFLERGLEAVGMREIMGALQMTPGGFYRHFESKEALIAEANGFAAERILGVVETAIVDKTPAKALEAIASFYLGQSQAKGNTYLCPLAMIGAELSHADERVRAVAVRGYERFVSLIAGQLPPGKGKMKMASGIVSTLVGAVMLANVATDGVTARSILDSARDSVRRLAA